ncbi:uncharacterized protein KIAA1614 isoform X1 [Acipenser ruthenus]|uniref:uncharacterized protein KIAA1614 isoform X1 n=1 Tax=Acipenser ruthenus TaxID=7906 RepID=UPI002741C7D3|nr:uncharacterized protein KIAA1614 isoform X1 [Acipenser ruthenus]XP_058887912.1 uncharacterized protein KIAA1614 isoform X1 [Acipenser ruthenus]
MTDFAVADSICPSSGIHSKPALRKKRETDSMMAGSDTRDNLSQMSPTSQQAPGSAVSALQSKVKALSERRACGEKRERGEGEKGEKGQPAFNQNPRRTNQDKDRPSSGRLVAGKQINSDEEVDPALQIQTYLTDKVLKCDMEDLNEENQINKAKATVDPPWGQGEGASLESLRLTNGGFPPEEPSTKSWMPPKGFWKATRPETLSLEEEPKVLRDMSWREESQAEPGGASCQRKPKMGQPPRVLQRADSLESRLTGNLFNGVPLGGLWRADSWESVCSNASSLSLAERVEMNRGVLKQILDSPKNKEDNPGKLVECNGKGISTFNDSDWDSGVSLQDCDHGPRAFVCDELPLSPRHEQAKRLLERARMKARAHPLKADHSILPFKRDCLESKGPGAPLLRKGLSGREAVSSACGNLSDSSSGDSGCGPRRKQSPTRVRFEDESAQDAEVRYLERLQQRKRAAERGQGVLVSKPDLSSYINGSPTRREPSKNPEGAPLWSKNKSKGKSRNHGSPEKCPPPGEQGSQKCNACGSFMPGYQTKASRGQALYQAEDEMIERVQDESYVKVIPYWVPPSNHRMRTERIKETYIGEVTSIDDVESPQGDADPANSGDSAANPHSSNGIVDPTVHSLGNNRNCSPDFPVYTNGETHHGKTVVKCSASQKSLVPTRPMPNGAEKDANTECWKRPVNPYGFDPDSVPSGLSVGQPSPPPSKEMPQCETTLPGSNSNANTQPKVKKSALKSGSKSHINGQHVVKVLPSPQYRLIHLDTEDLDPQETQSNDSMLSANHHPDTLEQCRAVKSREHERFEDTASPKPSSNNLSTELQPLKQNSAAHKTACQLQSDENVCHYPEFQDTSQHSQPLSNQDASHERAPRRERSADSKAISDGKPRSAVQKFLSAISQNTVKKLGRGRSSSMEHLSSVHQHGSKLEKEPSLQSLRRVSPFSQLRKASSVQSLPSLKRKPDRSISYLVGEPAAFSLSLSRGPRRSLSVEDVGDPSALRSVGRVAKAYPDGTLLLQLSRPSRGPFGFFISRGHGRADSGVYVQEMGDSSTEKLYAGLLGVGDEIVEVNGEKVSGLTLEQVNALMIQQDTASLRVLRQRGGQR